MRKLLILFKMSICAQPFDCLSYFMSYSLSYLARIMEYGVKSKRQREWPLPPTAHTSCSYYWSVCYLSV